MKIYNLKLKSVSLLWLVVALFSACGQKSKTETVAIAEPKEIIAESSVEPTNHMPSQVQNQNQGAVIPGGALPTDLVCMVNNAYMGGKKQVPVQFENKTYYGCCNMCVDKIKNSREVRVAVDPLTGKEVDKATAFITLKPGSTSDVLYFESENNYKQYSQL